ncbi:IS3 family transposase [Lactiplantibacillus plantarum]|uniref:IS3 family transposase n=1 Tax=Lactiplantibacillus plantarum TaxID=1590 RepID=UPI00203AD31D|nr:IS3 family transposase [Lactiplantibacillus plantarum]MCM2587611.1 IS3 family transposase [Lactiplantibacillus plantarum]MCM2599828.1 IS3 family transposase [Lactiplantibacillus plantarum]MCM2603007.1 IS3 family transposase [Lactiplantibacillus plantarum]MCM2610350.1 IS3 family transposase [Lactiplantibacillus plantarum]MCM2613402.1 IS3 family transposase [Lactiplantibacillus plantarum]
MELVDELRQNFQVSIKLVLKAVRIPRSTYYYAKEHRGRNLDDSQIIQAIDEIRQQDPKYTRKYGYRRITGALHDAYGFKINHKRVLRIMREQDWLCGAFNRQKRKYNSYKGTVGVIAPNRLKRRFKTDRPYQKLVTDVSEFRYGNQSQNERVYLEPVLDLFNGEVLAFNISDHPTVEFALKPLKEALNRIPVLDYRTTFHTDQGFQYQHRHWQNTLKEHHVFQSMSRKATCLDNAAMESFFHIMKVEVMDEHFETKTALIEAMNEWIDFYNHRRIKTKLDGKSPIKYRELTVQKAA